MKEDNTYTRFRAYDQPFNCTEFLLYSMRFTEDDDWHKTNYPSLLTFVLKHEPSIYISEYSIIPGKKNLYTIIIYKKCLYMIIYDYIYASCTALVALPVEKIFHTWVSHRYVAAPAASNS